MTNKERMLRAMEQKHKPKPRAKRSPPSQGSAKIAGKLRKKDNVTYTGIEESSANIKQFLSTTIPPLDVALTGKVGTGFPVGRVVEMIGNADVGKTTLGCYLMREAQRQGGVAMVIDTEKTLTEKRIQDLGLSEDSLLVMQEQTLEVILERIRDALADIGDTTSVIFLDTVAGTQTTNDKGRKIGEGKIGAHASALSAGMRALVEPLSRSNTLLLLCNQRKQGGIAKMFVKKRDLDATLGGDALKFHATTRLNLSYAKDSADVRKKSRGFVAIAEPLKNKLIPSRLVTQLMFSTQTKVAEFHSALSCLFTLRAWGAAGKGAIVYTDIDKRRYTEAKFIQAYESSSGFKQEVHGKLENVHRVLAKGGG